MRDKNEQIVNTMFSKRKKWLKSSEKGYLVVHLNIYGTNNILGCLQVQLNSYITHIDMNNCELYII